MTFFVPVRTKATKKIRRFSWGSRFPDLRRTALCATLFLTAAFASLQAQPTTILSEGFEAWESTPAAWSIIQVGEGTIAAAALNPQSGEDSLHFNSRNISEQQAATLTLDLSGHVGAMDLSLEFWARRTGSDKGKLNLSISGDGAT